MDIEIERRIFNDCTSNGDFEFSVHPTNLFWRVKGAHAHNRDRVPLNELNNGRTKTCWSRPETAKNAKKTP